jgi:hypothetical protein
MQIQTGQARPGVARKLAAGFMVSAMDLVLASTSYAVLPSGVYQTVSSATVEEEGDRVPNGRRVVPLFATLTFDTRAAPPSLTATITNAVLEGGAPFALTVRSSSRSQPVDGIYEFTGDYLGDIYPTGTQYVFDWRFSASTNGDVVWNGDTEWAGGHLWLVTISNITLVPLPWLDISRVGPAAVQITWATNFDHHVLEYANQLPALNWSTVTNVPVYLGEHFAVTLDMEASERFYRLRKP